MNTTVHSHSYVAPTCFFGILLCACWKGELGEVLAYNDGVDEKKNETTVSDKPFLPHHWRS